MVEKLEVFMKMSYLFAVMTVVSLLVLAGCPSGTDNVGTNGEAVSLPANLDDAQKSAADQSVELLEQVEEQIVNKADTLTTGDVSFTINDETVEGSITQIADAASASFGGSAIPAAAAEAGEKVIDFKFKDGEEIGGTQKVTTYADGSWDMEGEAIFKNVESLVDGNPPDIPIKYEKTKVDKDGKITGGGIKVDDVPVETEAFNALKKIAVFYKKLNARLPASTDGSLPDPASLMDITMESSAKAIKNGETTEFESFSAMYEDANIMLYGAQLIEGTESPPVYIDGSLELISTVKNTMKAKSDAGFSYDFSMVHVIKTTTTSVASDTENYTTGYSVISTLNLKAEVDGISVEFKDIKNANKNSFTMQRNPDDEGPPPRRSK